MGAVVDVTPLSGFKFRTDECLDWLHRHPRVRHFVALDDMDLRVAGLTRGWPAQVAASFDRHFVHVNDDTGLVDDDVASALQKLQVILDRPNLPAASRATPCNWS